MTDELARKIVTVDDVMKLSVDLIRLVKNEDWIIAARVVDIVTEEDGTKTLSLERVGPPPEIDLERMNPQDHPSFRNFEDAFDCGASGAVRHCNCGRVFYNSDGGWDFEPGELESLKASGATDLDHACGEINFNGKTYAIDCPCWHDRAMAVIEFLNEHAQSIADFLTNEKKRKTLAAIMSPVVE